MFIENDNMGEGSNNFINSDKAVSDDKTGDHKHEQL